MSRPPKHDSCILAARGLRKQVKLLSERLSGVRQGEDIESIHRARVASRRLRAVLAIFRDCWQRKQVKTWKQQVREFARDLSEARDHDVHIEFLARTLTCVADAALVPGIARLLSHVEQQRQWLQPRILHAVQRIEHSGVLKEMQASARKVLDESNNEADLSSGRISRCGAKVVRKRLKRLLTEAPALENADGLQQHHAMRIAAKRLRYTLELLRPYHAAELDVIMDAIKHLQTLLGEIHDCDVWAENLDAFARADAEQTRAFFGESRRFNRMLPGLVYLRRDRKSRRDQAFAELVAYWDELLDKRMWNRLRDLLESDATSDPSSSV